MEIGKKLKELRLQNDLTLRDLASRSELTKGFLSGRAWADNAQHCYFRGYSGGSREVICPIFSGKRKRHRLYFRHRTFS